MFYYCLIFVQTILFVVKLLCKLAVIGSITIKCVAGTSEDYAQIMIAVFGGFLQQLIGPRNMLLLATLPNLLSWALVGLGSRHLPALILSRVSAGVSLGLIASNVYIADVVSAPNLVFFNYMRQVFTCLGAILMYALVIIINKVNCYNKTYDVLFI